MYTHSIIGPSVVYSGSVYLVTHLVFIKYIGPEYMLCHIEHISLHIMLCGSIKVIMIMYFICNSTLDLLTESKKGFDAT